MRKNFQRKKETFNAFCVSW